MTTAEKLLAMRDELATIDPGQLTGRARDLAMNIQMARGFGFDIFELVVPDDPTDLEQFVDDGIRLLLSLRGDDLPPFDFGGYGEQAESEAASA